MAAESLLVNVSVSNFPIEILPIFYRFGYALPFYHISKAVRTIVFGTKNQSSFYLSSITLESHVHSYDSSWI